ncbi:MAG: hypothetical protein WDA03_04080 [Trueperaceae bacterium]|jgi:hypothetical protein
MQTLTVRDGAYMRALFLRTRSVLAALALLVALGACAPGAFGGANPDDPVVAELQRTAEIIFHRMELGRLELGSYTTTPLVDATIPEGATLTLVEFDTVNGSTYTLMLTSSRFTAGAWRITPRGISRVAAG